MLWILFQYLFFFLSHAWEKRQLGSLFAFLTVGSFKCCTLHVLIGGVKEIDVPFIGKANFPKIPLSHVKYKINRVIGGGYQNRVSAKRGSSTVINIFLRVWVSISRDVEEYIIP